MSRHLWWAIVVACSFAIFGTAEAQAQNLTPEQIARLSQLTSQQREAILDALNESGGSVPRPPSVTPVLPVPAGGRDAVVTDDAKQEGAERIGFGDSVVVELIPPEGAEIKIETLRNAVGRRTYRLNSSGQVNIPGVGAIPLVGLTPDQAQLRISSERALDGFIVSVYLLSLEPVGLEALTVFGADLFDAPPSTFAPATDVPVPATYVIGPGDSINLLLYGNENAEYRLQVGRDGQINLPGVGPIPVTGMRFGELREELVKRVQQQYIGVNVSVTMGEVRSIGVYVMGDVKQPGSYTVSGLATLTNALFVSGGVSSTGSLRNIQLKRANRVVTTLDIYDLLLKGNNRGDTRLRPGDVIFIPTVGDQVSILGEVKRPAIYELKNERTLGTVLALAGGLMPSAYRREVRINRFSRDGRRDVVTAAVSETGEEIHAGDVITVMPVLDDLANAVSLSGYVERPGAREWRPGMRLSSLIPSIEDLRPRADLNYTLIRREIGPNRGIDLFSASIEQALLAAGSDADPALARGDQVFVFSMAGDRAERIRPLLDTLRQQSTQDAPALIVGIGGQVRAPGSYPLEPGMRLGDLLRASGNLLENAYVREAELTRYYLGSEGDLRETFHQTVDLARAIIGDTEADVLLQPSDYLTIKEIPNWGARQAVEIIGEVRFPGEYNIQRGEYLSAVIARAGGVTNLAFPEGSVFLREDLREREARQLRQLYERLQSEVATFPEDELEGRSLGESMLAQLRATEAQGRLVIDLDRLLVVPGDTSHDILVKDGDQLYIPPRSQEITVIGEVQYATSHIYEQGLDRRDYIQKSGGPTATADTKRIYVVRANGDVISRSPSGWFGRVGADAEIRPGDTIVVPLDADRVSKLALWGSVSQIIYNIGVAAAAVASF